ncbi:AraC family transcriptional regulator [Vibrio sp. T187]|uniref:helix-turn-helix transcriptional regulator n=1 Tax=Vibrio TaxID=662 RepID=UPI0010C98971|nr:MULTISPECIES: AraC family transcriptional regulator [Vibrio]MBW3694551.1 AraC family transcriptional regulator [Vibrio sp. T187]
MNHQYQVNVFRAEQLQKLRNVRIHSPSIIQIISGSKRLYWRESTIDFSSSQLLLCEASASLTFENLPQNGRFMSRMFSFHYFPCESMLELSLSNASDTRTLLVSKDDTTDEILKALLSFNLDSMSKDTQVFWLKGLYQNLAERGVLHLLFPSSNITFSQRLSHYLSKSPSDDHPLEETAGQFAMSRATLIRKLKQEGTQYREVLAEVRLSHALSLMQSGCHNVAALAKSCGYQSEGRFSLRFKGKFGVTPRHYIQTFSG